jgi:hypothetical protein
VALSVSCPGILAASCNGTELLSGGAIGKVVWRVWVPSPGCPSRTPFLCLVRNLGLLFQDLCFQRYGGTVQRFGDALLIVLEGCLGISMAHLRLGVLGVSPFPKMGRAHVRRSVRRSRSGMAAFFAAGLRTRFR